MPIDQDGEETFYFGESYDYKAALIEQREFRQEHSTIGWFYIGVYTGRWDRAKIGMTTGALGTRASSPQNPEYALLCAFKVKDGTEISVFNTIDNDVKAMLEGHYECINHVTSGKKSEWFRANPTELRKLVHDFLYEKYSYYMNCYYCSERDMRVINSWENNSLLYGRSASPYKANDLSNPPVAFECLVPPGCGEDCQCW